MTLTFQSAPLFCSSWWVAESCHNRHFSSSLSALLSPCRLRGCSVWGSLPPKWSPAGRLKRLWDTKLTQTSWTTVAATTRLRPPPTRGSLDTGTSSPLLWLWRISSSRVYKLTAAGAKGQTIFPACFCLPIFAALNLEWLFLCGRGGWGVYSRVILLFFSTHSFGTPTGVACEKNASIIRYGSESNIFMNFISVGFEN